MTTDADQQDATRDQQAAKHLAELDEIRDRLAGVPALYERRIELYELLRSLDPPVPYATIAEHTDAGVEAVRVAIHKRQRAAAGNPVRRRAAR